MSQKLLNGAEISPTAQEMGSKAVSEGVRADRGFQGEGLDPGGDEIADTAICQTTTAMIEEQGVRARAPMESGLEVGPKGSASLAAE
jgi:hypothetical protein